MSLCRDEDLAAIKLLAGLSELERRRVGPWFSRRVLRPGDQLIGFGQSSGTVFVLLEGSLQVVVESPDGRAVIYRDFERGDVVGDFSAIDNQPRNANVYASTAAAIAGISDAHFRRLMAEYPSAAMAEMQHLVAVIRNLTRKIYSLSTQAAIDRLKAEILRLGEPLVDQPYARRLRPMPTQSHLAARIGSHREAVSRHLTQLEKDGFIVRERGGLLIPDIRLLTIGDPLSDDR